MQQLFYFFQKYKYFLFFLLLEIFALGLIINNHSFHKSKFISSANGITGGLLDKSSSISDYFKLENQNKEFAEENLKLKNLLEQVNTISLERDEITVIDSINFKQKYQYLKSKIIENQYSNQNNSITINSGKNKGISYEMAVVNSKGIIGITDDVSAGYARVKSILSTNSKINARLKNSNHFGTLTWNTKDYNIVQLTDIPRQAVFKKGDTIITGGMSTIFPEGILIGTIVKTPKINTASNTLDIKLFNDMSNLGYVYVIKNLHKQEIQNLQQQENE